MSATVFARIARCALSYVSAFRNCRAHVSRRNSRMALPSPRSVEFLLFRPPVQHVVTSVPGFVTLCASEPLAECPLRASNTLTLKSSPPRLRKIRGPHHSSPRTRAVATIYNAFMAPTTIEVVQFHLRGSGILPWGHSRVSVRGPKAEGRPDEGQWGC